MIQNKKGGLVLFKQMIGMAKEGVKKTLYGLRVFFSLPNIITSARIVLVWPIIKLFENGSTNAFWLYLLALSTDVLDGQAAQWLHKKNSLFGKLYDPFADKVLHILLLISVFWDTLSPVAFWYKAWVALTIVLLSLPGFKYYFKIKRRVGANIFGKMKLCFEGLCFMLLFKNQHALALTSIILADAFACLSIIGHLTIKEEFSFKKSLKKFFNK